MNLLIAFIFGIFGLLALFIVTLLMLGHKAQLIYDIYPAKSAFYSLKYYIALWLLHYLRLRLYDPSKRAKSVQELEQTKQLDEHPLSYDVISFAAASNTGQTLYLYMERRHRGVLKICLYLWLPDLGLLSLPNLPDMVHFTTDGLKENNEFRGSGFHIYAEAYMQRWRIHYAGPLYRHNLNKQQNIKLDLVFNSKPQYFDYNRDLSTAVIADSVAREAWDSEFINMVQSVEKVVEKRTHYEQIGNLSGHAQIADNAAIELNMKALRDHNFGTERCLSQINRYVYMTLFLHDGTSIVVGNLSQPTFFLSSLKLGYISNKTGHFEAITKSNFELYTYGEKGTPPKHQNFIVHTAQRKFFVQIEELQTAIRYSGGNWESKIFNQFVSCKVNGISGYGITEFLYKHHGGRPNEVGANDPTWYLQLCNMKRNEHEFVDDFGDFDLLDGN